MKRTDETEGTGGAIECGAGLASLAYFVALRASDPGPILSFPLVWLFLALALFARAIAGRFTGRSSAFNAGKSRARRIALAVIAAPFFLPQWHQREYLTQRYPRHIWRFVFADAFLLVAAHGRIISRHHVPLPADCDRFEVNHPVVLRDLLYGELNR